MPFLIAASITVAFAVGGPRPMGDVGLGSAGDGTTHTTFSTENQVTVTAERPGGARAAAASQADGSSQGPYNAAEQQSRSWATSATDGLGGSAPAPCVSSGTPVPCAAPSPARPVRAHRPGPRTPTLTDIASFHPHTPSLAVEPRTFGIVGRPTNFIVSAEAQTLTGTLFDLPVTVRFTPVAYRFDYGDGVTKSTATPGSTWRTTHDPLFTATRTSHVYRHKAVVTARVSVAYMAQVSFNGSPGWYTVDGFVTATAPGKRFPLYVARTVLVEHTCSEDPRGPGCPDARR